jgi:ribonuclease I
MAAPSNAGPPMASAFTYYVLSLYWLPTLCLETPRADECNGLLHGGFVVHGLSPERDSESQINCGGDQRVSDTLVRRMADLSRLAHSSSTVPARDYSRSNSLRCSAKPTRASTFHSSATSVAPFTNGARTAHLENRICVATCCA